MEVRSRCWTKRHPPSPGFFALPNKCRMKVMINASSFTADVEADEGYTKADKLRKETKNLV